MNSPNPSTHTASLCLSLSHNPSRLAPGFDPIENAFTKLKALLRKAAARTVVDLCRAIGAAFTPAEWANYFAAAGYDAC